MTVHTATTIFHYPDGVLLPGESADLDDDVAARGVEAGSLGTVPEATEPEPPAPSAEVDAVENQE